MSYKGLAFASSFLGSICVPHQQDVALLIFIVLSWVVLGKGEGLPRPLYSQNYPRGLGPNH